MLAEPVLKVPGHASLKNRSFVKLIRCGISYPLKYDQQRVTLCSEKKLESHLWHFLPPFEDNLDIT